VKLIAKKERTPSPSRKFPSSRTKKELRILTATSHPLEGQVNITKVATSIVALAQIISEKKYYPYQVEISMRIAMAVLQHEGEMLTALLSRQSGKTEVVSSTATALELALPALAGQFPDSWHLNMTDEQGVYRGFLHGFRIGIYAPKLSQAQILFERCKSCLDRETTKQVLSELRVSVETRNGNTLQMSNGSRILCESASKQSKIEGATHDLLILEEAQDINDMKVKKSLHPMTASTMGTIVKIGTSANHKCDFYSAIKANQRMEHVTSKKSHFFFPYTICAKYNSLYAKYVEQEKIRIGEESDEFQMAYCCKWVFERGMFVTDSVMDHPDVMQTHGVFSLLHDKGVAKSNPSYSLVCGIDWGCAHDSTVLTVMAVDWSAPIDTLAVVGAHGYEQIDFYRKHIIAWYEWAGDDYETQYWEIVTLLDSLPNLARVVMDTNSPGRPIYARMLSQFKGRFEIQPFDFCSKKKSEGYKYLHQELSGRRCTYPANAIIKATTKYRKFRFQMMELKKEYKNGLMRVAHPDEKHAHDDYPDSFMLANWGCREPASTGGIEINTDNFLFRR
jgi:hypothetical protein